MFKLLLHIVIPLGDLRPGEIPKAVDVWEKEIEMPVPPSVGMQIYLSEIDDRRGLRSETLTIGADSRDQLLWDVTNKKLVFKRTYHYPGFGGILVSEAMQLFGFKLIKKGTL